MSKIDEIREKLKLAAEPWAKTNKKLAAALRAEQDKLKGTQDSCQKI